MGEIVSVLRAAQERAMLHREAMRHASVQLRLWPEGLVIECLITGLPPATPQKLQELIAARGREIITWDELSTIDVAGAVEVVDRACAKARRYLAPAGPRPKLAVVS